MRYEEDILMHHGIKGQKWGVRKQSYSDVLSSLSDKDFVSDSKNAYRISDKKEKLSNSPTYVTLNKKDRANYIVGFSFFFDKMYSVNMKTTNKMISPSERKRVKAFVDMYKNDPEVKKSLVEDSSKTHMIKSLVLNKKHFDKMYSKMDDSKLATKAYKDFTFDLTFNKELANKYIDKFKDQGYNSLIDDHDASNGMSKNPLIVFNAAKDLKVSNYQTISDKDKKEALKLIRRGELKHMDTTFGQDIMSDSIEHHGVKGQKWGVRKKSRVTLSEVPDNAIIRTRKKVSKKYRAEAAKNHLYDLRNSEGKKIGNLNVYDESKKSMNVVWIGVDPKHRGQGYATDAMRQVIDLANKKKMSQVTLEVPGESPDAHHIYKKLGFKDDKKVSSDDDYWGGLTSMKKELKHMDTTFGQDIISDSIEHHGVKGMKWGQRRSVHASGVNNSPKPKSSIGNRIQTHYANKARAQQWRSQYNNRGSMSTDELRRAVNRLNLENQFEAATRQAMASSSKTVFSKYKDQYINGAVQGAVNNTNQVGNRVGQAAARAMIKRIGMTAAAAV